MGKKRKIIVLSCMIALLAVTAVFNFVMTTATPDIEESLSVSSANYFAQYRSERITTRNEELLQLDAIIASAGDDSEEKANALAMKIELTEITEKELLLESLIKAYGFEDAVVKVARKYAASIGEMKEDFLRNLYIYRKENTGNKPILMIDAILTKSA